MSILRGYQRDAVAAFWEALSEDVNRVAVQMATGLGKTVTLAGAIDEWLSTGGPDGQESMARHGDRAMVLVERDELVRQTVDKLDVVTRGRWSVGVVKATRNEVDRDIIVASVATLRQPGRKEQISGVGFIVVDECHHATAKTYQDILEHYGAIAPQECPAHGEFCACIPPQPIPVLGVTATLARGDGQGLGEVWQDLAFSRDLRWGIRKGFLIDLIPYTIKIPDVDMSTDEKLDTSLAEGIAPEAVVKAWLDKAVDRDLPGNLAEHPSTVLFAPLVRSAEAFAAAFNAVGIKAEVIHGAMAPDERKAVLDRYEAGVTTVLCNAMVLIEGWDSPRTMCVIVARPSKSTPLVIQMIGRGARVWLSAEAPPREDQRCVLLLVQGATTDLDMVADLREAGIPMAEGRTVSEMADEWDIGKGIEDAPELYAGPVRVERWDKLVQTSTKAWNYTKAGVPFLPTKKRGKGYVFVVERTGEWLVWSREPAPNPNLMHTYKLAVAPDLELAMALAEDECQDRGGDLGALLADKDRAWRKAVPSEEMQAHARRLGLDYALRKILAQKAAGKAGRLSDLISREEASIALDRVTEKIKARR